jgi:hypothetical protein
MINGNQDAGMLALMAAMETATAKCREHGFGLAGTRNTPSSTGALGYYAQKVAEQGFIAVVLAQSPEFVAPHGAKQVSVTCNPPGPAVRHHNMPSTTGPSPSVQAVHPSIVLRHPQSLPGLLRESAAAAALATPPTASDTRTGSLSRRDRARLLRRLSHTSDRDFLSPK